MRSPGDAVRGVFLAASERLPSSERLDAEHRLRRSAEFTRCYRSGRRVHVGTCNLLFVASRAGFPRLGISASRRVGKAVVRNRLRRWVREIVRRSPLRGDLGAFDIVVHLKPAAAEVQFQDMKADVERLMSRVPRSKTRSPGQVRR